MGGAFLLSLVIIAAKTMMPMRRRACTIQNRISLRRDSSVGRHAFFWISGSSPQKFVYGVGSMDDFLEAGAVSALQFGVVSVGGRAIKLIEFLHVVTPFIPVGHGLPEYLDKRPVFLHAAFAGNGVAHPKALGVGRNNPGCRVVAPPGHLGDVGRVDGVLRE